MPAPMIDPLPALPTFPTGPGLPDQPGVFIPQFLAFLNGLGTFGSQANAVAAYLDSLGGGGGGVFTAATRTALAAVAATNGTILYLSEAGCEGWFKFSTANLQAACTADTTQAINVPPTGQDGSTGAWVRVVLDVLKPEWFGARGDWTGAYYGASGTGTDNLAAFNAMQAWVLFENRNYFNFAVAARSVLLTGAAYHFSAAFELKATIRWIGSGNGGAGSYGTRFHWAANSAGFIAERYDTVGTGGPTTPTTGAAGSIIDGISFESAGGTPNFQKPGLWLRDRVFVSNCHFAGFPGPGLLVLADTTTTNYTYGNANGWVAENCRMDNCMYGGLWVEGGDANAGSCRGIDVSFCGRYGINIRGFLGSGAYDCEVAQCGMGGAAGLNQTSMVSDGSYIYRLIDSQDASAAGTAPTSGASNAVWQVIGAGGPWSGAPLWSTYVAGGGSFVSGGSIFIRGTNARAAAVNMYAEGDSAPPIFQAPSFGLGGLAQPIDSQSTQMFAESSTLNGTFMASTTGFGKLATDILTGEKFASAVGGMSFEPGGSHGRVHWTGYSSLYAPQMWRLSQGSPVSNFRPEDLFFSYFGDLIEGVTGPNTAEDFGCGTAQPEVRFIVNFAFGDFNQQRRWNMGSAAPTTGPHARGEFKWNNVSGLAVPLAWFCTANGTPGTWAATYPNARADPSTGIGYVAGAGAAVTQATSKATATPAINNVCGQVTMNNAALAAATIVSFTLTNSVIAADDEVRVWIKSGNATPGTYRAWSEGNASGSRTINVKNESAGPLSEALVLGFLITKAVIS